jgi:RNA polymerase sigma-70 factor (ECF subfamily)
MRSAELAGELSQLLQKEWTAPAVRQVLHRAREKFADLLLEEVVRSLVSPTSDALEEDLCDLGLWDYCRASLKRRFANTKKSS